jgi:hypothetical protein
VPTKYIGSESFPIRNTAKIAKRIDVTEIVGNEGAAEAWKIGESCGQKQENPATDDGVLRQEVIRRFCRYTHLHPFLIDVHALFRAPIS